jgi:hypothetical protein
VNLGIIAVTVASAAAIGLGLLILGAAIAAFFLTSTLTGEAIRVRRFGDDEGYSHYLAVYTGKGRRVRAWHVRPEIYPGLQEYSKVTVTLSPLTGYVRSIQPA